MRTSAASAISDGTESDDCDQTDGIDAYDGYLGPGFPDGLFVCQDGFNDAPGTSGTQNFKYASLQPRRRQPVAPNWSRAQTSHREEGRDDQADYQRDRDGPEGRGQVDHVRRAQSQDGQRNDEYGERAQAHVQEVGELRPRWQRAVAHHVRDDVRDEHGEQGAQDRERQRESSALDGGVLGVAFVRDDDG